MPIWRVGALDYLVGFTLSPVLWRKLPGARSAGRVQSVALRLVCQREEEIEAFIPQEYWSILADVQTVAGADFQARITAVDGEKKARLDIKTEAEAADIKQLIEQANLKVRSVEAKPVRRNPFAPFTTSTLQQEASRKLGFAAARTMQIAQRLYEGVSLGGETTGLNHLYAYGWRGNCPRSHCADPRYDRAGIWQGLFARKTTATTR